MSTLRSDLPLSHSRLGVDWRAHSSRAPRVRRGSWRVAWVLEQGGDVVALLPRRTGEKGVEAALVALVQASGGVPGPAELAWTTGVADHVPVWNYFRRQAVLEMPDRAVVTATRSRVRVTDGRLEVVREPTTTSGR